MPFPFPCLISPKVGRKDCIFLLPSHFTLLIPWIEKKKNIFFFNFCFFCFLFFYVFCDYTDNVKRKGKKVDIPSFAQISSEGFAPELSPTSAIVHKFTEQSRVKVERENVLQENCFIERAREGRIVHWHI